MNTSPHHVAPEEVMAFLDGELSPSETQAVSAHVEECAICSALAAQLRGTSQSLLNWKVGAITTSAEHTISDLVARTSAGVRVSDHSGFWHWKPWAVGASATVGVLLLIAIATPNLLRSRMAANEASAVGSLRTLNTALSSYSTTYGHFPPSLVNLGPPSVGSTNENAADLIDSLLANGHKSGYVFDYKRAPAENFGAKTGYTIRANPAEPGKNGSRVFFTDQTGVIRIVGGGALNGPSEPPASGSSSVPNREPPQSLSETGPFIARTVELTMAVQAINETRIRLEHILKQHSGYIGTLSASADDGSARTLTASLRVPAQNLDASVDDLKKLGRVTHESQSGEEVTQQHIDLVAQLNNSHNTEARLNEVLHKSHGQTKDILEIERESARVRGEIERMEAERKALEHRVEYATIEIQITEDYKAQITSPSHNVSTRIHNAFVSGYRNASETLLGILLFFAEYGPTLLVWLLFLLVPLILIWRRYRRVLSTI